eukprot:Gb_05572 [translate_table: standard]
MCQTSSHQVAKMILVAAHVVEQQKKISHLHSHAMPYPSLSKSCKCVVSTFFPTAEQNDKMIQFYPLGIRHRVHKEQQQMHQFQMMMSYPLCFLGWWKLLWRWFHSFDISGEKKNSNKIEKISTLNLKSTDPCEYNNVYRREDKNQGMVSNKHQERMICTNE